MQAARRHVPVGLHFDANGKGNRHWRLSGQLNFVHPGGKPPGAGPAPSTAPAAALACLARRFLRQAQGAAPAVFWPGGGGGARPQPAGPGTPGGRTQAMTGLQYTKKIPWFS